MEHDLLARARAYYQSYVDKDRAAIEALLAPDFHFSSPLDNRLDRATYFARCWPNSAVISAFKIENLVAGGDRVFVTYDGQGEGSSGFRNTEILSFRDGQVVEVQCYFGWPVPHRAAPGGFIDPAEMTATTSRE